MSVFDEAKKYIGRALIERYFPGGEWKGDDYWIPSPLRSDKSTGSFHIYEYQDVWCFKDFADDTATGDFITLVSLARGLSKKEAAEDIIRSAGGVVPDAKPAKQKKQKIAAVIPIPEEARAALNNKIKSDWARSTHGEAAAGWKYFTASGEWCFSVARFNRADGSKDVIPYYYGTDGRWHEGQAYADGRPLYGLLGLLAHPGWRVVIVEGEKCVDAGNKWAAEIGAEIVFVSWSSGSGSTAKSDFSPLTEAVNAGLVVMWPDADKQYDKTGKLLPWIKQPGMKAALAIANRLPGLKIADVETFADVKDGYDIADHLAAALDPMAVIDGPLYVAWSADAPEADDASQFFRCLGYDRAQYWFLTQKKRATISIGIGSFNGSKLQELAPLAWWTVHGMTSDQQMIKVSLAQDYVIRKQEAVGRYDPRLLRGAGVWREGDDIVINDGRHIVTRSGEKIEYADFHSKAVYLSSDTTFSDLSGEASTREEGVALMDLVGAQGWAKKSSALAVLGWSLIAPFGGILEWRPHVWLLGRKGTGKSYILDTIIRRLLGNFSLSGTSEITPAALRRKLGTDACPATLDEMDANGKKELERISAIGNIERNSSDDASGYAAICGSDGGTIDFLLRSCFCNASVNLPALIAAVDSRIIKCELKWCTKEQMDEKRKRSAELAPRCMKDPARFQRRIFRSLPQILKDIEHLHKSDWLDKIGTIRDVDLWSPLLASVWALVSEDSIACEEGKSFVMDFVADIADIKVDAIEDEDRVIEHILTAVIETDARERRTIAELLLKADGADTPGDVRRDTIELLSRYGVTKTRRNGIEVIGFATRSDALTKILKETPYADGYDAQIKRHALCVNPQKSDSIHFGAASARARLLDWKEFKKMYMEGVRNE